MQRAAFPELQGRPRPSRHQRPGRPDRVLIGLKIATFIAACGVLVVMVLLVSSGPSSPTPRANPPRTGTAQAGDDAPSQQSTPTAEQPVAEPPVLRTETAEIKGVPATTSRPSTSTSTPTTTPSRRPRPRLPVVGEPCPGAGMWSVTERFEPVVCYGDSSPRWRRVF
jgi:hypothetical protein